MITAEQVTALTAQAAKAAVYDAYDGEGNLLADWQLNSLGQPIYIGTEISSRGVGIYGQTPAGLTLTGYLKPGTLNLITSPEMTITVLNTPAVWTGQYGITSLVDYLDDPILQNLAQIEIMKGAYQGLIDNGVIDGTETARYQSVFLQPATRYGVDAVVSWVEGVSSTELTEKIVISARQGQYAIDFINRFSDVLNTGIDVPGFDDTVAREDLDQTLTNIIGNQKIPSIDYVTPLANVAIPATTNEEGQFRFSPNNLNG